jgi:hypothetical protein
MVSRWHPYGALLCPLGSRLMVLIGGALVEFVKYFFIIDMILRCLL